MTAIGGSVESIGLNGRQFAVPADAEIQRILGGWNNDASPNGDGSSRLLKTRVAPGLSGVVVEVDDERGDHEYLQDLANLNSFWDVVITYASGVSYQGSATITGELQVSSAAATAGFDMKGTGTFTKQ